MRRTKMLAYGIAICCSVALTSCGGTNEDNAENELQEETQATPGAQEEARGTDPNTPGAQTGDTDIEATELNPDLGGHEMMPSQSIVQNISSDPELTTMASVLRQAGLVDDLDGTGPYTILAPTNDAFEALPEGTLEDLMKPENKERLVAIVKNHVVAGKISAADLQDGNTLRTMANAPLKIDKKADEAMINGAEIEKADVISSNGVIHVINKVLVPAE
ncbi:fasciclin domain-containing protein [Pontibacter sp. 172403-2]|uniref:fasciclin domain-containing protein n=1 Tax=Pontibacter rufus TaxID=2791028 RepID=UPI0018AFE715|nr:fasciclin domain-containing protein [Pontibacter sp. 172403-2]MBF9252345.1 fasciclin domain-containing protein [Pontibacter sp. 172403-2]